MPARRSVLACLSTGLVLTCSLGTVASAGAATPAATRPATHYSNCAALNKVYPHGVGRGGARDHVTSGRPVTDFTRSDRVYNANTARDRDKDHIACEKH